jgi:hypothetical protein
MALGNDTIMHNRLVMYFDSSFICRATGLWGRHLSTEVCNNDPGF